MINRILGLIAVAAGLALGYIAGFDAAERRCPMRWIKPGEVGQVLRTDESGAFEWVYPSENR